MATLGMDEVISLARPDPDGTLTEEQAAEWRAIVNRLPADWFPRETWALLAQYCRHVVSARKVAALIAQAESDELDVVVYDRLLKMQERESRCLASVATKMRISQQGTLDREKKKGKILAAPPWQPVK